MKPILTRHAMQKGCSSKPVMFIRRVAMLKYLFLLFGLMILTGCFQEFYRTGTTDKIDAARIQQFAGTKFLIIHYQDTVLKLENVSVTGDAINATVVPLSEPLTKNLTPDLNAPNILKGSSTALSEVHLFSQLQKNSSGTGQDVLIPLKNIYRMDVYEFDEKNSRRGNTWGTVGLIAVVAAGMVAVVIASSGPMF